MQRGRGEGEGGNESGDVPKGGVGMDCDCVGGYLVQPGERKGCVGVQRVGS